MGVSAQSPPSAVARRDIITEALKILLVGTVYYGAARLSLDYASLVRKTVTPVWPPTGIALVGLIIFGLRVWPGISLAAFLVNIPDSGVLVAAAITVGNTLAPLVAFALVRRAGFDPRLARLRDAAALVFLGALTGMLVSATLGTTALWTAGRLHDPYASVWSVWWTGDAMGVLVFAPLLLALLGVRFSRPVGWARWFEGLGLGAGAAIASYYATRSGLSLLYLVFPFLIWAALRFQQRGAAPIVAIVSLIAVSAAVQAVGPFAGRSLLDKMITLQTFNGSVTLTALLLAALTNERMRARLALEGQRRKQALELNDEIVQGLSAAKYALDLDDAPLARRAVERTLAAARTIVSDLLHAAPGLGPGDLVRERPAEVGVAPAEGER